MDTKPERKKIAAGQSRHLNQERLADYLNYLTLDELREMYRLQQALMLEEEGKLKNAINQGNQSALIMAAHKIASSSGAACLTTVEELARKLEKLARQNKLEQAGPLLAEISKAREEAWETLADNNLLIQDQTVGRR